MARRLTDLGFVSIFYNGNSGPLYSTCYEEDDSKFEGTCMRIIEAVTLISKTQCKADAEKYAQDILEIAKMQNLRILSVFERVVKEFKEADENTFRELQKILFEKE